MGRALTAAFAALLAVALLAPAAQGATKYRTYRTQMYVPMQPDGGTLELNIKFQNSTKNKKRFNPRVVRSISLGSVPLTCSNAGPPGPTSQYSLTTTLGPIPVRAVPPPHASKPKKNRYAYRFSFPFQGFAGTMTGTIDKSNSRPVGTPPRTHGQFTITDLDADATHFNCATNGLRSWSTPSPQGT